MTQPTHVYSKEDQYELERSLRFDKTNPLDNKQLTEIKVSPNLSRHTKSELKYPLNRKKVTLVLPEIAMTP